MNWIAANIRWIMFVSGVLTMTMLYSAIAPVAALTSTFGDALKGPLAEIVVRSWARRSYRPRDRNRPGDGGAVRRLSHELAARPSR